MQISAANLLIASQQGKPAPKPQPSQSFSAVLSGDKPADESGDFAPLSFKSVEKPAAAPLPAAPKAAAPYGSAASALGSQLNIVV